MERIARSMRWAVVGNHHKNPTAVRVADHLRNCGKVVTTVTPGKGESLKGIDSLEAVNFIINPITGMDVLKQATEMGVKDVWFQPGACSDEVLIEMTTKNSAL